MRRALPVVAALLCAVAVIWLREAAMSRHERMDPDSRTEVVLRASDTDEGRRLEQRVRALFDVCLLEVHGTLAPNGYRRLGEDTFRFAVRPALDDTDERQLHGCLEDAHVDHIQGRVLEMDRLPGARAS